MNYNSIRHNYLIGAWNRPMVLIAVKKGVITLEQANAIFAEAEEMNEQVQHHSDQV